MSEKRENWQVNKETDFASFEFVWKVSYQTKLEEHSRWFFPTFVHVHLSRCIWDSHEDTAPLKNSLLLHRYSGWGRTLHWCKFSAYSGAYEAIARELRFILEDLAQALYIDQHLGDSQLLAKIKAVSMLEDTRLRGSRLINKLNIDDKTKQEMKDMYDELCGFVHPSADLVTKGMFEHRYIFSYIEHQFHSLLDVYERTADLIFSTVLARFPEACERFQNFLDQDDEEYLTLQKKYTRTSTFCKESDN